MVKRLMVMAVMVTALCFNAAAHATVQYDFAADTQGWAGEDWGSGLPALQQVSWSKDPATGSLEANTSTMTYTRAEGSNWGKVYLKGDFAASKDLTAEPLYTMDFYAPDNIYYAKAKLGVRAGGSWDLTESNEISLNPGWNTLVWDMSGTANLADARQLGIEVSGWLPVTGDAKWNIDNVATNPVPEPASMLLLGAGLAGIFGARKRSSK
ncbi:MAG TPA: PEP-CTERM sorting domain-containing protein [Candidatus Omnitrophota bacterium]|nr:PEP-CTERM sorting domain-containing protein [Candidatus Omnitrophota bacterium]HOX09348.1 PEP-CTERM sorting domain-containing protein [Candidatus Omnitrophota bacterium]HPN66322.1 PEP-CTERM sorting domain-containing protein [Candidatus Omnitrophota bacterium]HRZ67499.1 PEP-CTERM sorting domain-containing protein [Candidatus Omnitrophota bacterium]